MKSGHFCPGSFHKKGSSALAKGVNFLTKSGKSGTYFPVSISLNQTNRNLIVSSRYMCQVLTNGFRLT